LWLRIEIHLIHPELPQFLSQLFSPDPLSVQVLFGTQCSLFGHSSLSLSTRSLLPPKGQKLPLWGLPPDPSGFNVSIRSSPVGQIQRF
jgi:hypothetical protein